MEQLQNNYFFKRNLHEYARKGIIEMSMKRENVIFGGR